jgi:hypothetical protein
LLIFSRNPFSVLLIFSIILFLISWFQPLSLSFPSFCFFGFAQCYFSNFMNWKLSSLFLIFIVSCYF